VSPRSLEALAGLGRELARCAVAGNRAGVFDVLDVLLDELARPVCGTPAPDHSGRVCDLAAGHAGAHWTGASSPGARRGAYAIPPLVWGDEGGA
jgi:hypothetical protein